MTSSRRPVARVRALITDVDGVLTDGGMYFDGHGQALKRFSVKDGYIVGPMQRSGVLMAWVTGDDSDITRARAAKMGIDELCSGVEDKGQCVRQLLARHGIMPEEAIFIGDDLSDLPAMEEVGFSACPADASEPVLQRVDLVTSRKGGEGAVREVCDLILEWNRQWEHAAPSG